MLHAKGHVATKAEHLRTNIAAELADVCMDISQVCCQGAWDLACTVNTPKVDGLSAMRTLQHMARTGQTDYK